MDNRDFDVYARIARERQDEILSEIEKDALLNDGEAARGLKRRLAASVMAAFVVVVVVTGLQLFL